MPRRLVLVVDLNKCNGCGSCTAACESVCRDVGRAKPCPVSRVGGTPPGEPFFYLPHVCNACDAPACAAQCPARAILVGDRDDRHGAVHRLVERHVVALPLRTASAGEPDVFYVPPLWGFREEADGTVTDDDRSLPVGLLDATFGPAVRAALDRIEEALRRNRAAEPSELADTLRAWRRADVLGNRCGDERAGPADPGGAPTAPAKAVTFGGDAPVRDRRDRGPSTGPGRSARRGSR